MGRMNKETRLVFNRYGNQYYFAQAWLVAQNVGMQAVKSKQERATAAASELERLTHATRIVAARNKQ